MGVRSAIKEVGSIHLLVKITNQWCAQLRHEKRIERTDIQVRTDSCRGFRSSRSQWNKSIGFLFVPPYYPFPFLPLMRARFFRSPNTVNMNILKHIFPSTVYPAKQNKDHEHYEYLLSDDGERASDNPLIKKKPGRSKKICVAISKLMMVSLAVLGFVDLLYVFYQNFWTIHTANSRTCTCGSTLNETKSLGCIFDSLALDWIPLYCHDEELTHAFEKAAPEPDIGWKYWTDENRTSLYTLEEIAELPGTDHNCFWVEAIWHYTHCTYYWKKLYRSRFTGVVVEPNSDNIGHLEHCEEMLLARDKDIGLTVTSVGFGGFGDSNSLPGICDAVSGRVLRI